jgi:hypothetical protein
MDRLGGVAPLREQPSRDAGGVIRKKKKYLEGIR